MVDRVAVSAHQNFGEGLQEGEGLVAPRLVQRMQPRPPSLENRPPLFDLRHAPALHRMMSLTPGECLGG